MKRPRYLFHVTDPENVEGIKTKGLLRNAKRPTAAVYLSTEPLSWYTEGLRILRVDISGLSYIKTTTFLPDLDEVLFWGDIPPLKGNKPRIVDVTERYRKEQT